MNGITTIEKAQSMQTSMQALSNLIEEKNKAELRTSISVFIDVLLHHAATTDDDYNTFIIEKCIREVINKLSQVALN